MTLTERLLIARGLPRKQVRVAHTFVLEHSVPADWTDESVEFWLNESTSCADNVVNQIREREGCACPIHTAKVIHD